MDVPVFSVSVSQNRPPRPSTIMSFDSAGTGISPYADPLSMQDPSIKYLRYKKRKKRHHSRRSERIVHVPLENMSGVATSQSYNGLSTIVKNSLIACPDASEAVIDFSEQISPPSPPQNSSSNAGELVVIIILQQVTYFISYRIS